MTHNIYKYRAIQEKMFREGSEMAEIRMRAYADNLKYFGNELVTKIQRHDGSFIFQMKAEVVEEMLRYVIIMNEAADTVYWWDCMGTGIPKNLTHKEKALMYFVNGLKPKGEYIESLIECYKGSPVMSFYRDEAAAEEKAEEKAQKDKLLESFSW